MARECPTSPGKSKRKGKDCGGYVGFKGKGWRREKATKDSEAEATAVGDIKGKGKGYHGTWWICGVVGHKSSECLHHRPANAVEDDVGGAVSHVEVDVGGVWMRSGPSKPRRSSRHHLAWVGAAARGGGSRLQTALRSWHGRRMIGS